jgi:hypothetical protein
MPAARDFLIRRESKLSQAPLAQGFVRAITTHSWPPQDRLVRRRLRRRRGDGGAQASRGFSWATRYSVGKEEPSPSSVRSRGPRNRADAGQRDLRAGCRHADCGAHRAAGPSRQGTASAGQKVLINDTFGGVGTFAVQTAKAFDAEVTGVYSPRNVDTARSLGADHVIDCTQEDFTTKRSALRPDARHRREPLVVGIQACPQRRGDARRGRRAKTNGWNGSLAKLNREDLEVLGKLLEDGSVMLVIDRGYELSKVAEALSYPGEGHAQGEVAINVSRWRANASAPRTAAARERTWNSPREGVPRAEERGGEEEEEEEEEEEGERRRADDGTRTHDLLHGKQTL